MYRIAILVDITGTVKLVTYHLTKPLQLIQESGSYCKTSNISHKLVGNKIVDHSDAVGALPVGTAPTTSSFST